MMRKLLIALVLQIVVGAPLFGQSSVTGTIRNDTDEAPIDGATIQLLGPGDEVVASSLSDDEGHFSLQAAPSDDYRLEVRRVGFQPIQVADVRIAAGTETQIEVRMGIDAVPIDPVLVIATTPSEPSFLKRYRERAASAEAAGRGAILTRAELDESGPMFARQIMDGMLWTRGCQPTVLLDGLPIDFSFSSILVEDIEGVEIYKTAGNIPLEFYERGMCGLVLFWQRVDGPGRSPLTWRRVGVTAAVLAVLGSVTAIF